MRPSSLEIRGVLFDFDGTLTFPGALDFAGIKRQIGCPPEQAILEFLDTCDAPAKTRLTQILEKNEKLAAEASRPNQGADECLAALQRKGLRVGILTRNSLSSVRTALEKFVAASLEDFAAVVTRDMSPPKPSPDGVLRAARLMEVAVGQLLVVGDFRFDVMAGKAAGAWTVLLTNGGQSVMSPGDPQPDFTINNLSQISNILDLSAQE